MQAKLKFVNHSSKYLTHPNTSCMNAIKLLAYWSFFVYTAIQIKDKMSVIHVIFIRTLAMIQI